MFAAPLLWLQVKPHHAEWERAGCVSREVWLEAGRLGLLCPALPEELGGAGGDILHSACVWEEQMFANCSGPGFSLHSDIVAPYLAKYGSAELKDRYLPAMASGECIGAIAMTEPAVGSDLKAVRTSATRRGDDWVLNGSKTFITNGTMADMVIVVARTGPGAGARGLSLFCVPRGAPGFERGPPLEKVGMHAQDTAELFFDDVSLPGWALLGEQGAAFSYLMAELPQERLLIAAMAMASTEYMIALTHDYVKEREAFGQRLLDLQTVSHSLARLKCQSLAGRALVDQCLGLHAQGKLSAGLASAVKFQATEIQGAAADQCVQLHGGTGYMRTSEVSLGQTVVPTDWAAARCLRAVRPCSLVRIASPLSLADRACVRRRPGAADLRRSKRDHARGRRPQPIGMTAARVPSLARSGAASRSACNDAVGCLWRLSV